MPATHWHAGVGSTSLGLLAVAVLWPAVLPAMVPSGGVWTVLPLTWGPWVQLISSWERDPQSSEFCQKNLLPLLLSYLEVPLYCKQVTICAMCCVFQVAARKVLSSPSADENDVGTVYHAGSSLADTFSSWSSCCWDCSPVCGIGANSGPTWVFDTPAVYPLSILR